MRRIHRGTLPLSVRLELHKLRVATADEAAARAAWKAFRKRKGSDPLVAELIRMAGARNRCVYCDDSRGADVDHFAPIDHDHQRTFIWSNHYWACPECNRRKSIRFPLDAAGQPTLIDPTAEDWWDHLVLDTATGVMAARYGPAGQDPRGIDTLEVFGPLNFESVSEGRFRSAERLREAGAKALSQGDTVAVRANLVKEIRLDDFGVAAWFALSDGQGEEPFVSLRAAEPQLWSRFVGSVVQQQYGSPAQN